MAKRKSTTRKKVIETPKRTARGRAKTSKPARMSAGRRNTHKSNGSLPESQAVAPEPVERVAIGEAMRRAVEALGDVVIDKELAPSQLREIGEYYDEVARRQAAYTARAEEAKTAKKSLESATELLLERVKAFTHPVPLPLFDAPQADADHQQMLDAAEASGTDLGEADEILPEPIEESIAGPGF